MVPKFHVELYDSPAALPCLYKKFSPIQINPWMVAANILNKPLRTTDRGSNLAKMIYKSLTWRALLNGAMNLRVPYIKGDIYEYSDRFQKLVNRFQLCID
jgi:hypothetical protein